MKSCLAILKCFRQARLGLLLRALVARLEPTLVTRSTRMLPTSLRGRVCCQKKPSLGSH